MKSSGLSRIIARLAVLLLFLGVSAIAQTPGTGAITGIVSDPSGRVMADADVVVVDEATHLSRVLKTTAEGLYRALLLPPGRYTVTVKVSGFAVNEAHAIVVTASQTTSLNVAMAIASAGTSVQVVGNSEIASLESSTLGGVVDEAAIQALPLSNRNYTQILGLSPGVIVDLPNAAQLGRGTQNVASSGATPTANNIQFNGIDANNLVQNSAANAESSQVGTGVPTPDSIQEFRVQTANFDAAYGRGTGANIDLVSKTGTNRFHGSAFEFVRNNIFNANDFFLKGQGSPRPALKQNQFGGSLGGPIVRDRTFFFGAYQGLTAVNGLGDKSTATLPLLTSDRSAKTLGAQFCAAGHGNASGYLTHAGGMQVACDGSNINPVALSILNAKLPTGDFAVPSPQVTLPTDAGQLPTGQSTYALPAHYREDQFAVNLDQSLGNQVLGAKNTLGGKFFYSKATTSKPFAQNGAATVPGWGINELDRNTMFVLADTHIFNSNLVNVARFGYMRFDGLSSLQNPILASSINQGTPMGPATSASNMPGLTIDGLFTIGDAGTPSQWQVTNSFIWQDTVAWTHGRHAARFGAEFKRHQVDQSAPIETDGLLDIATFNDFLLGQSAAQNRSPNGFSNVTESMAGGGIFRRDTRYNDYAFFAQNDWKLMKRLTLNVGLRYEIFGSASETHGRLANFNPFIAVGNIPDSGTFSGFTLPSNYPGSVPAGLTKTSFPGLWKTPLGDVSPRFGFAWQMTEKPVLVLRGGFGIYYDRHSGNLAEQTLTQPPFASLQIISGAPNATATLASPFVPLILPNSSYPIFSPRTSDSFPFIESTDPNIKDSNTSEYNLNVQYAMAKDYLLQVGYVGTKSRHRSGQLEFNQSFLASPQNPINGETTNSVSNVIARMPYAGISPGSLLTNSDYMAAYNALQVSMTKRMVHGLQFQTSYTWSKNLDEINGEGGVDVFELQLPTNDQRNPRQGYGLAGDDRAQRLVVNFTWQVPKWSSAPLAVRQALSNWQFSGVGVIQGGAALTVTDANAGSVYGNLPGEARAQATGKNPSTRGSLFDRVMNGYLDPAAFTRAPEAPNGTSLADQDFGNSAVGIVRGPGQHNVDAAVERLFPITERMNFRFRTEFFNLTNTPQFGNPGTSVGFADPNDPNPVASASFGRIGGTSSNPRIIQFAAKLMF